MKLKALIVWLVAGLMPGLVHGQAGLFWDNSARVNASQGWDSGNRGTSALGQLESLAGRKVDTSRVPAASQPQQVQQAPHKVIHKPHTLSSSQQLGVSLFGAVLENVLMDSSSGNAAQAQAQEQQRIAAELQRQQQLQKMRMLHNQWRAEWDTRDQTTSEQLSGVFDPAPTASRGTAFFGVPGGADLKSLLPDVDLSATDSSVVYLPDQPTLTVRSLKTSPPRLDRLPTSATDVRVGSQTLSEDSETTEQGDDRLAPARLIAKLYWEHSLAEAKERVLDYLPEIPGFSTWTSLKEYKEAYDEKRELLSGWNQRKLDLAARGADGVISGRLNPEDYWQRFQQHTGNEKNSYLESAVKELDSRGSE